MLKNKLIAIYIKLLYNKLKWVIKMIGKIVVNLSRILIIFVLLQTLIINSTYVQAFSWGDIFSTAEDFIDKGAGDQGIDQGKVKEISDIIYNTLFSIGVALSVIIGAILGIKFMISSADEKAQIKEALVPYAAGCVVVFGAFGIWKLVMIIGSNL